VRDFKVYVDLPYHPKTGITSFAAGSDLPTCVIYSRSKGAANALGRVFDDA